MKRAAAMFILFLAGCSPYHGTQDSDLEGSLSKACRDDAIRSTFERTLYPFLRAKCAQCHSPGNEAASRPFASADFEEAYTMFSRLGRARIESVGVATWHKPPATGPQNQAYFDSHAPEWEKAEASARECAQAKLADVVTYSDLIGTNRELNVIARQCLGCHSPPKNRGKLDLTRYDQAFAKRDEIRARMNLEFDPMPPAGLLPEAERRIVDLWIEGGARP